VEERKREEEGEGEGEGYLELQHRLLLMQREIDRLRIHARRVAVLELDATNLEHDLHRAAAPFPPLPPLLPRRSKLRSPFWSSPNVAYVKQAEPRYEKQQ